LTSHLIAGRRNTGSCWWRWNNTNTWRRILVNLASWMYCLKFLLINF